MTEGTPEPRNERGGFHSHRATCQCRACCGHRMTFDERFWSRVEKTDTCWVWAAARTRAGYGQISMDRVPTYTHRLSWEMHHGPIPEGMHVLHRCDNPPCVNPDHLFLGDPAANTADKVRKGRHNSPHSDRHWRARLAAADVIAARRMHANGSASAADLAAQHGVHINTIRSAIAGRTWRHLNAEQA